MKPLLIAPARYDANDQQIVRETIERTIEDLERPAPAYTVDNPSTLRTFDVNTADVTVLRRVLGTLIADLTTKGVLGEL